MGLPALGPLISTVEGLLEDARGDERAWAGRLERCHPEQRESARNLIHYTSLRGIDLRPLQSQLTQLGLSSLGRNEARVLPGLEAVLRTLRWLDGRPAPDPEESFDGPQQLAEHAERLLGPGRTPRSTRIMVTAPSDASDRPDFVQHLLEQGMDILRINCAKDDADAWRRMAEHARRASRTTGLPCKVLCDVAGPKLRTGESSVEGEEPLRFKAGDRLILTAQQDAALASKARHEWSDLPRVACAVPEVLADLRAEQRVWFDDGKIGGRVVEADEEQALIEVTQAQQKGAKLKSNKGINFPDTELSLPSLMPKDLEDLNVIVEIADMVGQSFLRGPDDVEALTEELHKRQAQHLGVILKVETPTALQRLPEVLLSGMRNRLLGVMVARGDLAVEVGFERLAEAQEEILWMSEAAHAPVVWATQVLEDLAKKGLPTRAEVTDAAMSARAECVMLNKGPYIPDALRFLNDVLGRMDSHQQKKRAMLRRLSIAEIEPR